MIQEGLSFEQSGLGKLSVSRKLAITSSVGGVGVVASETCLESRFLKRTKRRYCLKRNSSRDIPG
jgi:hypothetical protein